jgi:inositol-1,4,5-trisphosphate 5-phosphatase
LFLGGKFSNAEKSRKGYLLTSLRIGSTCINFVNLHLYHDADNSTAAAETPSKYTPRRLEAFLEAMSEVIPVLNPSDPLFIFGDFNTRLDAKSLLRYLTERLKFSPDAIRMGKKEVTAPDAFWDFFMSRENHNELQQFDNEPRMLMDALAAQADIELCELPVHFPPTYMLDDTLHDGRFHEAFGTTGSLSVVGKKKLRPYKKERLPAWCDRIFLNSSALELITGFDPKHQQRIRKQNSGLKARVARDEETEGSHPTAVARSLTKVPEVGVEDDATCLYDSASLECMDHEAVFLLF